MSHQSGVNDCCMFAADAVLEITGVDVAAAFRGYRTHEEATSIVQSFGGFAEMCDAIASKFGVPEVRLSFAQRGDLVLVQIDENSFALAIVDMDGIHAVTPGQYGLLSIGLLGKTCLKAWRIGG